MGADSSKLGGYSDNQLVKYSDLQKSMITISWTADSITCDWSLVSDKGNFHPCVCYCRGGSSIPIFLELFRIDSSSGTSGTFSISSGSTKVEEGSTGPYLGAANASSHIMAGGINTRKSNVGEVRYYSWNAYSKIYVTNAFSL